MTALDRADRRCGAMSRRSGERCGNYAMRGARVCRMHGGSAPRARTAAARREAERKATAALRRQGAEPIANPLEELQKLAAEIVHYKDFLGDRVEQLQELRYQAGAGEQTRGELMAYERGLDRTARVLGEIARLNLDDRLVRIAEGQAALMVDVYERTLDWLGIAGDLKQAVRGCLIALLRSADAGGLPERVELPEHLTAEVTRARAVLSLPDRTRELEAELRRRDEKHARDLEMAQRELETVRGQRDRLREAVARRGPLPPLAIEAAPVAADVLAAAEVEVRS